MKEDKKCDKGWHDGSCCCNCKNFIELFKHPCNTEHKGKFTERAGFHACIVQLDCDGERKGTIYDHDHGYCELHISASTLNKKI